MQIGDQGVADRLGADHLVYFVRCLFAAVYISMPDRELSGRDETVNLWA